MQIEPWLKDNLVYDKEDIPVQGGKDELAIPTWDGREGVEYSLH